MIIQEIIDTIIADVPGAPFSDTVDTVKIGDAAQECSGIAVTFLANVEVIERAAALNANLLIAHEPLFYKHLDPLDWLQGNSVYDAKRRLIEDKGIVVWRFHDYLHSIQPDPTVIGMFEALGWKDYQIDEPAWCCRIPTTTVGDLTTLLKSRLNLPYARVIGDLDMTCQTIGFIPGFPGPDMQVELMERSAVDVVICGEMHEWETPEYVRDAVLTGKHKATIVIGHAASEEPGMRWVIPWLRERLPGQTITFVPTAPLFQIV